MTIQDFMELLIDGDSQHFNVYDNEKEEVIFDGFGSKISDELLDEEISSIDNISIDNDIITLNIN